MMIRVGVIACGAFAIAGLVIANEYDKKVNYLAVQARITDLQETCYMEKKSGRTTSTSDTLACETAEFAVKSHPKWQGYDVKYKINVSYSYVSPADSKPHSGKLELSAYPDNKKLATGGEIKVLASKTAADKTRSL